MNSFLVADEADSQAPALYEARSQTRLSYGDLRAKVAQFEADLPSQNALVFLFCRNDLATAISYLAAVQRGHAVTLLDAGLNPELRETLIERYRPELVIGHGELAGYAPSGRSSVLIRSSAGTEPPPHPELSVLLSTSGSTGSPKLVRLSRAAVEANARGICSALELDARERPISSLPLHYSYGLSVLNSHLLAGAEVVLTSDGIVGEEFWQVLRDRECTSFAGVPYSYQLLRRLDLSRLMPPSLKTMTQAGGKLADPLVDHYYQLMHGRGGRFFVMYGQTEATARISVLPAERLAEKLGSAGLPLAGGELRIEAEGGEVAEPEAVGEVIYRGPNVMMGYALERGDLTGGDELSGELRTGDLGYMDREGYLWITGRLKRIAKVFGLRINLEEVEAMIRPAGPAAVLGDSDRLLVFCEFGDEAQFAELRRALCERLGIHHSAFVFRRIDALPLTPNGKVDYRALPV